MQYWADLHWLLSQIPPSNDGRVHLFRWPEQSAYLSGIWLATMGQEHERAGGKSGALAARIKPILAGNDPDIKGKRRRSFLPAPQRLSPCQRGQCPAGGGLKASAGRLKVALDAAPARTLSSEEKREPDRKDGRERQASARARERRKSVARESGKSHALWPIYPRGVSIPAICP
jgi:hypothetical protein